MTPGRWYRAPDARVADARVSTCDHELCARVGDFRAVAERALDAPHVTLYYDIETTGLDPETTAVIQVSLVFACAGALAHLVALGGVAPIAGVRVHACDTEARVLQTFRRLVVQNDPDFLVAYNGVNFDNAGIAAPRGALGVEDFWFLSRLALRPARLRELRLASGGMGENVLRYFDTPGRANFDWYVKLQRDLTSEPSYKLDRRARTLCGDQKGARVGPALAALAAAARGRPPPRGCAALEEALRAGRARVRARRVGGARGGRRRRAPRRGPPRARRGRRALRAGRRRLPRDRAAAGGDAARPRAPGLVLRARLGPAGAPQRGAHDAHRDPPVQRGLPRAARVDLLPRPVRALRRAVLRRARVAEAVPLLLQRPPDGWSGEGAAELQGATVVEPECGFFTEPGGVSVLDWKSLYQSLMMAHNLCPSTLLPLGAPAEVPFATTTHAVAPDFVVRFAHRSHHRGVLPRILEELSAGRAAAKRQMRRARQGRQGGAARLGGGAAPRAARQRRRRPAARAQGLRQLGLRRQRRRARHPVPGRLRGDHDARARRHGGEEGGARAPLPRRAGRLRRHGQHLRPLPDGGRRRGGGAPRGRRGGADQRAVPGGARAARDGARVRENLPPPPAAGQEALHRRQARAGRGGRRDGLQGHRRQRASRGSGATRCR